MGDETDKKTITLTEGETKLFVSIMKNLEADISFNAEAVAQECGYKSGKVAKDRWSQVKKNKLGLAPGATPGKKTATPAKKRKGGEDAGDDAETGTPTPAEKARTQKAKKEEPKVGENLKEEVKDEGAEDGDEE